MGRKTIQAKVSDKLTSATKYGAIMLPILAKQEPPPRAMFLMTVGNNSTVNMQTHTKAAEEAILPIAANVIVNGLKAEINVIYMQYKF